MGFRRFILVAAVAGSTAACSGGGESAVSDPDQVQNLEASATAAKLIVDCSPNDNAGSEIESLEIVRKSNKMTVHLTVSGPGDFFETYSYRVTETARHTYSGPNFDLTVSKHASKMTAIGPKSAQLFSGVKLEESLDCAVSE